MVEVIEHCWIPLRDGTRLAAKLWLPDTARTKAVPAILEYLPYRKSDGTAQGDPVRHAFFAAHGYVGARVDLRGTGDSDGLMFDEYHEQELRDGMEVIAWLAGQPWCNGRVGMIGISWGGFNALQLAARRPPALGAIISVAGTDDRYADDVHYLGGNVLARDALTWPTSFTSILARPPDPRWQGAPHHDRWRDGWRDGWRDSWLARLDAMPHYAALWLQHQTRDDYWRHGSVRENYADIKCPVYVVGGWSDAYKNAVPRLLEGLSAPRKGLIGPWAHNWPNQARPQPAIGFLTECLRWWDEWLKGIDTGIMAEPMLRAWLQDRVSPAQIHKMRPGRWVSETAWPPEAARFVMRRYALSANGLIAPITNDTSEAHTAATAATWERVASTVLSHGLDGGAWCPFGMRGDFPADQRAEDGRSLSFASPPNRSSMDVLGHIELRVMLSCDQPNGALVARLCDVAPDGTSLLVTRGMLNLCLRNSDAHNEPLYPGTNYEVKLHFDFAGHTIAAGHHWQLALAPSYWPMIWPMPKPVTLHITNGELCIPERVPNSADTNLAPFAPPDGAAALPVVQLSSPAGNRAQSLNVFTAEQRITQISEQGRVRFPDGLETTASSRDEFIIRADDPNSARLEAARTFTMQRDSWQVAVTIEASISTDEDGAFVAEQTLTATERGRHVRKRHWRARIPRLP